MYSTNIPLNRAIEGSRIDSEKHKFLKLLLQALGRPFVEQPNMVAQQPHCFDASIWYWNSRSLSVLADQNTDDAFNKITKRINGNFTGKEDRDRLWNRAKMVLGC